MRNSEEQRRGRFTFLKGTNRKLKLHLIFISILMISWHVNISCILWMKFRLAVFTSVDKTVGEMNTFYVVQHGHSLAVLLSTQGTFKDWLAKIICTFLYVLIENISIFTCKIYYTLGKASKKKFGKSWDIVPTGRGGTLSLHISVPTEKITCSEWLRTYNKVIKYF